MRTRAPETVLVVEDQRDVLALTTETLEGSGFKVLAASSGAEALALAERYTEPIHLLLTDVVMPGMSGKTLAAQLEAARPGIRTIYMSGYANDVLDPAELANSGAAYIEKPFAPRELAAKVRDVLDRAPGVHTVLVVDDEDGIRDLFRELLTSEGYQVLVAGDGRQAFDILRRPFDLDLVITDLVMPNQEGIETIQAVRRQFPKVKIIAMSGAFGGQFLATAKMLGADATLMKPVAPDRLCAVVAQVLGRA